MKKKLLILACGLLGLSGCVSTSIPNDFKQEETRFTSKVKLSEFNTLSGKYIDKFTTAYFSSYTTKDKTGNKWDDQIRYRADAYKAFYYYGSTKIPLFLQVIVRKSTIQSFNEIIDKYLTWNEKSLQNGDMFTKKIGIVDNYLNTASDMHYWLDITFHSGNEKSNFMIINSCFDVMGSESCSHAATLNIASVKLLKSDIEKLKNDKFKHLDVKNSYN